MVQATIQFKKKSLVVAISAALLAPSVFAAIDTGEKTLSTLNSQWTRATDVAGNGAGRFITVWKDYQTATIKAQYSNGGVPEGPPFIVSGTINDDGMITSPVSVAMNASGGAVVAWQEYNDTYVTTVVNGSSSTAQNISNLTIPDVAIDDSGNFTVVGSAYSNYGSGDIRVRPNMVRFSNGGYYLNQYAVGPLCTPKVNDSINGVSRSVYANYMYPGNYYGWVAPSSPTTAYSGSGDLKQGIPSLNSAASTVGYYLPHASKQDLCRPTIAMNGSGNAAVTWADNGHVYARRYAANGAAQDVNPIQVDSTPLDQTNWVDTKKSVSYSPLKPVVAMDSTGNFVVAWQLMKTKMKVQFPKESYGESQQGIFKHELSASVMAQRFDNTGQPTNLKKGVAVDVELVKETEKVDQDVKIAMNGDSNFALVWSSRFEDFKQLQLTGSNWQTNNSKPSIKGTVYAKRFTVTNGFLKSNGGNTLVAAASVRKSGEDPYAYSSHWLPAIAMDNDGSLQLAWSKQFHLNSLYSFNWSYQNDTFDAKGIFIPGKGVN